jgi:hypothetical protein
MWWRRGCVYEIHPRSFQDTDGDGVGDLRGVADRLPYLARLGVDAVWLTPFYESPMRDFGYDISDHCAIDPSFGTMDDFDALVAAAHDLGIKVVLDFVPNHTSDRHPWFEESRRSRLGRPVRRLPRAGPRVHDRPRRGAGGRRRDPPRDRRRAPVHGRGDLADRAARPLLRRERGGRAPAVQLPPDRSRVDAARDRRPGRALRGRAAGRRVAELGARQPRPAARGEPRRAGPGARGGDAAAHAARDTDALLRRRARDGRRRGATGARRGPGRPRSGALADAVDRSARPRLLRGRRRAVAARRCSPTGAGRRRSWRST